MECANENKLALGTYVLREEANQWWKNAKLRLGERDVVITWEMFKREFFNKYFPADVKNKKVVEFMKLEQGNMSVAEYAAEFESLCAFSPHYNTPEAENDKCVKFESGLRPDIKYIIGFAEIRNFTTLVAKARICDEDGKAKSNYFKAVRGKSQDRAKPYEVKGKGSARGGKGKEKAEDDKKRKDIEFQEGDHVFLRVTSTTGVGRALKSKKLTSKFIGPYQILERIGKVAYRIALPVTLSNLHDVFHVSQLRKYVSDPSHVIESDDIQVKDNLTIETIPLRIEGREVKKLRNKEIASVKVIWGGPAGENATWELESKMKSLYPELFSDGDNGW
ncbi:hypothetical protein TSUD_295970 [Trifolium subterraneum]|uniref:Uncharacterized protein n=1 Tax=Trifolium subterraneum TaxID=3900 RepID=A0A2Z6LWE2_TRISU|nr:hypothetical protein TSUD_295970 [Trifolium subterraneum]